MIQVSALYLHQIGIISIEQALSIVLSIEQVLSIVDEGYQH